MASKSSFHESEQVNCESDICNQNQNWCVIFNGYRARKKKLFTSFRSSCILFVSRIAPECCKSTAYDLHSKVIETQLERGKKLCRSETSLHLFIEYHWGGSHRQWRLSRISKKLFLWFSLSKCDDKGENIGEMLLTWRSCSDLNWRPFAFQHQQ